MQLKNNTDNHRIANIVDCPMGAGKSSAAINFINSSPGDEKFVFATPYNSECMRIHNACNKGRVLYVDENEHDKKKSTEFKNLISAGNSVTCTHHLLIWLTDETLSKIRNENYTLIIDEAYDILRTTKAAERRQLFFLLDHNLIDVDDKTGRVSFINEFEARSCSGLNGDMVKLIRNGYVYLIDKSMFIWEFPIEVLNSFSRIIIMTYMFDAHPMNYYLKCNGYEFNYIGTRKTDNGLFEFCEKHLSEGFRYDVGSKIHILEDEKLNRIGKDKTGRSAGVRKRNSKRPLSVGWYTQSLKDKDGQLEQLGRNIRNVQKHKYKCSAKDFMWTCYKEFKPILSDKNIESHHVESTIRADNRYGDRHYLAYGIGKFVQPDAYNYFKYKGYTIDKDRWSLSVMLQWIWRSAIRNGEEIYIYIPSEYMRTLLKNWIQEISEGGDGTIEA